MYSRTPNTDTQSVLDEEEGVLTATCSFEGDQSTPESGVALTLCFEGGMDGQVDCLLWSYLWTAASLGTYRQRGHGGWKTCLRTVINVREQEFRVMLGVLCDELRQQCCLAVLEVLGTVSWQGNDIYAITTPYTTPSTHTPTSQYYHN